MKIINELKENKSVLGRVFIYYTGRVRIVGYIIDPNGTVKFICCMDGSENFSEYRIERAVLRFKTNPYGCIIYVDDAVYEECKYKTTLLMNKERLFKLINP